VSIETTRARGDAMHAGHRWMMHRSGCPQCVTAQRAHKPERMCEDGRPLYTAHREAEAELTRNLQLDKDPIPGQGTLWP
jgi:hypothetical protein